MRVVFMSGAACAMVLAIAGCGGHPSAVSGAKAPPAAASATVADTSGWAANRKHTGAENAQYQFTKNGADFGAASQADYVAKVRAFVDHPPASAETLQRSNGDRLIYDAKANVFAVVNSSGAPRTMFKPHDGAAYWTKQKDAEAKRAATKSSGGGDDNT